MSNYKTNVLNDNPITFWTFDYDNTVLVGNEIIDEVGNNNPLYTIGTNFDLQQVSLNDLEVSDQHSISIAKEGYQIGGTVVNSTTLEAPHSSIYNLEEFSVEFLINKASPVNITSQGEIGYGGHIKSPILYKQGLCSLVMTSGYSAIYMSVSIMGHNMHITNSDFRPLYDTDNHIVMTYKVNQTDINEYQILASIYINGWMAGQVVEDYIGSYPTSSNTTSWLFGSNGGSNPLTDYQTERLTLDQIAIYDYTLTDEQISTHYRKTKRYGDLVKIDKPVDYWRFNDAQTATDILDNEIRPTVKGKLYGNYVKYQTGTPKVIDTKSIKLFNGGVATFGDLDLDNYSNYSRFINFSNDYSVEFWFKTEYLKRGMLFSSITDTPNWSGLNIFINSQNDFETLGSIQVSESQDIKFNSELTNWNDGKWHHLTVKRKGNNIYLFIDGDKQGELHSAPLQNLTTRRIYMMSASPNSLWVDGNVSDLVTYDYALQDIQINHRFHFATRHRVFGHTLLEGAPVQAKVRFYNTHTGEKVGEVLSKHGSGEYSFYPYSNRKLDIVALIPDNQTTRYRVHAPISPAEFDDAHLQS